MQLDPVRVENPTSFSPAFLAERIDKFGRFTIQFSQSNAYHPGLLQQLNNVCRQLSDKLEVRFYGHYGEEFNGTILNNLPDVKKLSLDCLQMIRNEEILLDLEYLTSLHFGVFEFDRPEFLAKLDLRRLKTLILSENRKRNLDLTSLSTCLALENLNVHGHFKGLDAIVGLSNLRKITLGSLTKAKSIAFLRDVPKLEGLTLILGGRSGIAEFASDTLQTLQILRVRGLESLGDLSRFPSLRNLRIEDQIQLKSLELTGVQLERLSLYNCKALARLTGLDHQARLCEFWSSKVDLNVDELRDFHWPATAKAVRIFSSSLKWNKLTERVMSVRGYSHSFQGWE